MWLVDTYMEVSKILVRHITIPVSPSVPTPSIIIYGTPDAEAALQRGFQESRRHPTHPVPVLLP